MAKNDKINIDNMGVDKFEHFLQHNIKTILILTASLVMLFIAAYLSYVAYNASITTKLDGLTFAESMAIDNMSIDEYVKKAQSIPSYKDYTSIRSATMYNAVNNTEAAKKELQISGGMYSELASGMLYDLNSSIVPANYLQGTMRELWHYRNVLSSDDKNIETNLNNFKLLYPESQLYQLVKNWNVK